MKKFFRKKLITVVSIFALILSLGTVNVFAAESNIPNNSQPIVIGEYDGLLSDCWDSEQPMPFAVANVRINSYATYDSEDGIQVKVKLYVPLLEFPKPQFTSMTGTVTVDMNNQVDTTSFFETADGDSTIESDVDTGVTGDSGDEGTVSVAGVATANNALAGGGEFAISYPVTLP